MSSIFFISLMNGAAWGGSEELWFKTALQAAKEGRKVACAVYDWPEKKAKMNVLLPKKILIARKLMLVKLKTLRTGSTN